MRKFDTFIAIDWSGAKSPEKTGAIAAATCHANDTDTISVTTENLRRGDIAHLLEHCLSRGGRTLVGIDCNFGYAAEIGDRQFGPGWDFTTLWREVDDHSRDLPDFYAKGFWTSAKYRSFFWTSGKQNGFKLPRRRTEQECGNQGYSFPESPFKLIGPKQVGKGGLAGMRLARYIKNRHGGQIAVWPFEMAQFDNAKIVI